MDTNQAVKDMLNLSQGIDRLIPGEDSGKAHAMAEELCWRVEGLVEALARGGETPDWIRIYNEMRRA